MDDKKELSYVLSALGYMGVFILDHDAWWFPEYKSAVLKMMEVLNKHIAETCVNTDTNVASLFNAYTEKNHIKTFADVDNYGTKKVYADSGGLQMVTAGRTITPEIKKEIYRTQTYADYAMCFDIIPLSTVSLTRTRNERSNVRNKLFNADLLKQSALATGQNVKDQATAFRKANAKTKVIVIVQGNTADDMVDFFKTIASLLDEEDYDHIGGIAIADTCMGNGELESIEMLIAAHRISKICHENIKHHLHVLGVGSISRMRPILYLLKSGYLDAFKRISYDSSSHSSTFQYGLLKLDGGCKPIGSFKTPAVDKHFRNVYRFFEEVFSQYATEDEFIKHIFASGDVDWKFSTIRHRATETNDINVIIPSVLCNVAHTYFQIHNFVTNIDRVYNDQFGKFKKTPSLRDVALNRLLAIKDDEQMTDWMNSNIQVIASKRINRDAETATLESFFA